MSALLISARQFLHDLRAEAARTGRPLPPSLRDSDLIEMIEIGVETLDDVELDEDASHTTAEDYMVGAQVFALAMYHLKLALYEREGAH